ncbi:hypothetical protein EUGRSUZ_E03090 [Eucalyptus grandis]|uniref:Uncharacterized protein n=2 Tax=Eucalyptus grandis TaxID=71139 RepID=A0ACC3KYJ4_EUCGR|nr:hypothetical protein EUGRSUZ_E03090 [Eucalyptus grandis]
MRNRWKFLFIFKEATVRRADGTCASLECQASEQRERKILAKKIKGLKQKQSGLCSRRCWAASDPGLPFPDR